MKVEIKERGGTAISGEGALSEKAVPTQRGRLKVALLLTYFLYAILLDSASLMVSHQAARYQFSQAVETLIPAIPETTIITLAVVVAAYLGRLGYLRVLNISLSSVVLACLAIPLLKSKLAMLALLIVAGATFVFVKTASYTLVGLLTSNDKEHVSFMCLLEAVFMTGILVGNFVLFSLLEAHPDSDQWLNAFFLFAAIAAVAFGLFKGVRLDESPARNPPSGFRFGNILPLVRLAVTPLVLVFIMSNSLYVLSEQSAVNWFPDYHSTVIHLPTSLNTQQMITLLVFAAGLGRFAAAFFARKFHWLTVLLGCLFAVSSLVLFMVPLGSSASSIYVIWGFSAPLAAFILPLVTFFLAPIYPAINSAVLTAMPATDHARMAGLIMFFSAIGGIAGKILTKKFFNAYGAERALHLSLISIGALLIALFYFDRMIERREKMN